MIAIVMGVSGSGKSYLAERLAKATGWPFAEGDDYHSAANKAKMEAKIPLTDEDRAPWLAALHRVMLDWHNAGQSGILTCSALKVSYRAILVDRLPEARFIWLDPPRAVLEDRTAHRPGHFMPAALLESQLATLEPPVPGEKFLRLDGTSPIEEEISAILTYLES
jgi:gluconokinase